MPARRHAAMTLVRLNSGVAAQALLAHLRGIADVTADAAGELEVRVNLLGSFNIEAMDMELLLRLRAWEEAARANGLDVRLELEDEDAG
jgi:hypothetical protein